MFLLNAQKIAYENLISHEIEAAHLITEIRLEANIASRNVNAMAIDPYGADNATLESNAYAAFDRLDSNVQDFKEVYNLSDELETQYIAAITAWGESIPAIISAIDNGNGQWASEQIRGDIANKLATMVTLGTQLEEQLNTAQVEAVEQQEFYSNLILGALLIFLVIAAIFVYTLAHALVIGIVNPTQEVRSALMGFSEGNLNIPVEYDSENELGDMCRALRSSQECLSTVISDACYLLEEMSHGNFNIRTRHEEAYVGDLTGVLKCIRVINVNLSDTLAQINLSAEQVSADSDQVSTGAQGLAQGATMQASAVQELSATIAEISMKSQENARSSEVAMDHSQNAGAMVSESATYMNEMVEAMGRISKSSEEIGKIIATIENIAFQTNILALNAAVEAARAGSAGKGFAVVADEVRNLATKSDQAAKATKDLIDQSIASVHDGNEIVLKVSESLDKTVNASKETMIAIQEIAKAVEEESRAITQVTEGIDQISSVVQTNSATSQESAAASEELSTQANLMKSLMSKFVLRTDSDGQGLSGLRAAPTNFAEEPMAEDPYAGASYGGYGAKY
jgi:methyl-accepting chemotaxis protein